MLLYLIIIFIFIIIYIRETYLLNFKVIRAIINGLYYFYLLPKINSTASNCIQSGCKKILKLIDMNVKIDGNPITSEPVIFVANHQSYLDIVVIKSVYPHFSAVGKHDGNKEYILPSITKQIMKNFGTIFYVRGNKESGKTVRKKMEKCLVDDDKSILVFPEGGSYADGLVHDFYPGSFEVATKCGIKVQPITIHYNKPIAWGWYAKNKANFDIKHNIKCVTENSDHICRITYHPPLDPSHFKTAEELKIYSHLQISDRLYRTTL